MEVKFYLDSGKPLWNGMKHQICKNIRAGICGQHNPNFYIHFDKMIYSIGWFIGYVEIWKGKVPHEKNRWRIPFTAKVWDWGSIGKPKVGDYRMSTRYAGLENNNGSI